MALAAASCAGAAELAPQPKPLNTEAPKLTGTPAPGQTLTCSQGAWANDPTAYTYAWLRDGNPIAGQSATTYVVQSTDQGHAISCQVTASNSGGQYTISGLPSGAYTVDFFQEEEGATFQPQYYKGGRSQKEATAVSVTAPNTASGINAALASGGQISGKVTAASGGGALAKISVCASAEANQLGGGCTTTNGTGEYTISGLPSGLYELAIYSYEAGDYLPATLNGVSVSAPSVTAPVNVTMPSGGQISGTVTAAAGGTPIAGISVCAGESCAVTNASGEYTLSRLTSSHYTVDFTREFSSGNYLSQKITGVAVTAPATTTAVNAALAAGGEIEGTVHAPGGGPGADVQVCAIETASCAFTNASGVYTIPGLPSGEYEVLFDGFEGVSYAPQYYENEPTSAGAKKVSVTAGATTKNINAEMHRGAEITGQVTAASGGAGLANVLVCAEAAGGIWQLCTETGTGGAYTIAGLPGSSYKVEFLPSDNESFEFYEAPDVLDQAEAGVSVPAETTRSGVNAALAPGGQISGAVTAASAGASLAKILVCADDASLHISNCAMTNGGGGSVSAASGALSVPAPNSNFSLAKAVVFNAKAGQLDVFLKLANAGTLNWNLFFKNSDVGFADALGVGGVGGLTGTELALSGAETARRKHCKSGFVKHHGNCVRVLIPFASGAKLVPAGTIEIKVRADAKAIKALKAGHTLHVSGPFKFQSTLGGLPVTHTISAVIHLPRKRHKR